MDFTPRSPIAAAAANALIPGLGALYAGFPQRAMWQAAAGFAGLVLFDVLADSAGGLLLGAAAAVGIWIFFVLDALGGVRRANERRALTKYNHWKYYAAFAAVSLLLGVALGNYRERSLVAPFYLPTAGNEPTLRAGDRFMVDRQYFDFARGDLIVYDLDDGRRLVKRLVGLPGENVAIDGVAVSINGQRLPSTPHGEYELVDPKSGKVKYARHREQLGSCIHDVIFSTEPGVLRPPQNWQVPDNALFALGDNRDNSLDSRVTGPVRKANVLGKVLYVFWPPARFGAKP